jgi:hypothetical protein
MTFIEFLKLEGYELIDKFDSYEKALLKKYDLEQKEKALKFILLENVYIWKDRYEIWARQVEIDYSNMLLPD